MSVFIITFFVIHSHRLQNLFKSDDDIDIIMKKLKDTVQLYNKCIR